MSTVQLGANAKLAVGDAADALVDLTAPALGTGAIARSRTFDTRPVPGGRGRGGSQKGKFYADSLTVPLDANPATKPQIFGAQGQRKHYHLRPKGTAVGQEIGQAVVSAWAVTWDINGNSVSANLTFTYDGAPAAA